MQLQPRDKLHCHLSLCSVYLNHSLHLNALPTPLHSHVVIPINVLVLAVRTEKPENW